MPNIIYNNDLKKWFIIAEVVLTNKQKEKAVEYASKKYEKIANGEIGDRRKRIKEALNKLSASTIEVILDSTKESVLYFEGKY